MNLREESVTIIRFRSNTWFSLSPNGIFIIINLNLINSLSENQHSNHKFKKKLLTTLLSVRQFQNTLICCFIGHSQIRLITRTKTKREESTNKHQSLRQRSLKFNWMSFFLNSIFYSVILIWYKNGFLYFMGDEQYIKINQKLHQDHYYKDRKIKST